MKYSITELVARLSNYFQRKKKNEISLDDDSNLDEIKRPLKIANVSTPITMSVDGVDIVGTLTINGVEVPTEANDVDKLNDLSDVTFDGTDLSITGMDRIKTAGDLTFEATGGDIFFRAHNYGSNYDGGVEFNITSNTIKFQRNVETGLSGVTFTMGTSVCTIQATTGDDIKFKGDRKISFENSSDYNMIDFTRATSGYGDLDLTTANQWSTLALFRDRINVTGSASGNDVYRLTGGFLTIVDDTEFDQVFLLKYETNPIRTITAYADYSGTVAGTVKATSNGHLYVTGDELTISGTTDYNGTKVITKIDDNNFYYTATYTSSQTGVATRSSTKTNANRMFGTFSVDKDGDIRTEGTLLKFMGDSTKKTDDTDLGIIEFEGKNDADTTATYAKIVGSIADASDTDEAGKIELKVVCKDEYGGNPNTPITKFTIEGKSGTYAGADITIGSNNLDDLIVVGNELTTKLTTVATTGRVVIAPANPATSTSKASVKIESYNDADDYIKIEGGTAGASTISTNDDGGTNASLTIDADGDIVIDSATGNITAKDNGGNYTPSSDYHIATKKYVDDNAGGGGGGGTDTWAPQWSTRWYTRFGYYYYPSTVYGANYYNWNSASSGALTTWADDRCPPIVIPKNMTIKSYHLYGNYQSAQTIVLCIKKGTPSYGSAGDTSLSTLGTEQTLVVGTANIYNKIEETGLSVSMNAGDIIVPTLRRTTSTTSSAYYMFEGVFSIIGEYT